MSESKAITTAMIRSEPTNEDSEGGKRVRALDLFCGGGGAARGLLAAGFDEVVGIDNGARSSWRSMAREYPGEFVVGDAVNPPVSLDDFDFVWASPPCQAHSVGSNVHPDRRHVCHIGVLRELLRDHPCTCVENVPRSPLRADVVLEGAQFDLPIHRRRVFECSFPVPLILHRKHAGMATTGELATIAGHGPNNLWAARKRGEKWGDLPGDLRRKLNARNSIAGWRDAMGIDGMTAAQIAEAVPPAYAQFIGKAAIEYIRRR